jgi:aryl-alcohol dehydrogenase-like predicted oxidoreductase
MKYARLGNTGLMVSRICLGCMSYGDPDKLGPDGSKRWPWALKEQDSLPFFKKAIELGINFFDTANVYCTGESEVVTGRALKEYARREDVVIATKVHGQMRSGPLGQGLSRRSIFEQIDQSLQRLGTDYVDLYQIHRWDDKTPIEETLEALDDVVRAGKARYIGASSMHAWQFSKALYTSKLNGWSSFVSMQNHYNLLYREEEREMAGLCRDQGIGVLPWSPLARGRLARSASSQEKTSRSETDRFGKMLYARFAEADHAVLESVDQVAKARGTNNAQVALAWLLQQDGVTSPIIGATKMQHLEDAVKAVELTLSAEDMKTLEAKYIPHAVAGFG